MNTIPSAKVISFDMNGTLTQDHFIEAIWGEGVPRLYSLTRGISLDEAKKYVFVEYDKVGETRVEWYDIKYWFRALGLGDDWRGLLESFQHHACPFPDALPVLQGLGQGYQLVVISNASAEFIDIELGAAGLTGYFTRVLSCTSDFGEVKKTPEVYGKVCNILGIEPEEMIHVGDHRLFDLIAPQESGIKAFYIDRDGSEEEGDFIVHSLTEFWDRIRSG